MHVHIIMYILHYYVLLHYYYLMQDNYQKNSPKSSKRIPVPNGRGFVSSREDENQSNDSSHSELISRLDDDHLLESRASSITVRRLYKYCMLCILLYKYICTCGVLHLTHLLRKNHNNGFNCTVFVCMLETYV